MKPIDNKMSLKSKYDNKIDFIEDEKINLEDKKMNLNHNDTHLKMETIEISKSTSTKKKSKSSIKTNPEVDLLKKEILTILHEDDKIQDLDSVLQRIEALGLNKETFLIEIFSEFTILDMNPQSIKYILHKNYLNEVNTEHFVSKLLSEFSLEDSNALTDILITILLKKKIIHPADFLDI